MPNSAPQGATKHLTTAERPVDWEELKRQLPPGTLKPDEEKPGPARLSARTTPST
jgi:hypothetical protein